MTKSQELAARQAVQIQFRASDHTYWYPDGTRIPSVTEILDCVLRPYASVPDNILEAAAARGRAVDNWISSQLIPDFPACPELDGYAAAYRAFMKTYDPMVIRVQKPVYDAVRGYAGTPDLVCHIPTLRQAVILDWKTCALSLTSVLQVAAYAIAADYDHAMLVELCPDGSYRYTEITGFSMVNAKRSWLSVLACYHMMEENPRWFESLRSEKGATDGCGDV